MACDLVRSITPMLKVANLCFSANQQTLLSDLNLRVESPGVTVVLGPNGAGKSLLLRLLHGLLKPESGTIHWNDQILNLSIRQRQAMVFQKPVLLRRSVAANIDFVLKHCASKHKKTCSQILEEADLLAQRLQPARLLSGGEQQRLALARALATSPDILFLDEATASLDPAATAQIENRLCETRDQGVKLILVTHDVGQAKRLASDIVFMHRGKLLEHTEAEVFFYKPQSPQAQAFLRGELVI